ncbi:tetratricopeptide repeat protein 12-like isoform X2 [Branchiostoma floridae]|uniref:Tetratricopeptide repeat protein 12-like isoform X1 n=1 Tax=Branchiostoma floridae TaxID=7739 RepID=A0A9J7MKP1_BRAFL|nr:tetratricopeptide repeat protein 12-like isoform X1 [Branchiostoma floridae]XP_035670537.1 tetratricopeptide repeat protein 12-like isoform X2 [Branchiostoma floridae]
MADKNTSKEELDKFLQNVDDIQSIIKGMASGDTETQQKACQAADERLGKIGRRPPVDNTGVNRTVVNQRAFDELSRGQQQGPEATGEMGQEAFMDFIEKDAAERAARKKEQKKEATVLKEKGNEAFKARDFQTAVDFYTQGLEKLKDFKELWTNRAQAYIKLGQYDEALSDCDWAMRCDDKYVKAYIHKGRALVAKKEYDKAFETYQEALKVDPKQERTVNAYIKDLQTARAVDQEEEKAKELIERGAEDADCVLGLIKRIKKRNEPVIFYTGGLKMLYVYLKECTEDKHAAQTVFRTCGGFKLISDVPVIARCMNAPANLTEEEVDMCEVLLKLYREANKNNVVNQKHSISMPGMPEILTNLLHTSQNEALSDACVAIINELSQNAEGRTAVVNSFDTTRLMQGLLKFMNIGSSLSAANAVGTLNNLAINKKFLMQFRDSFEESLLPAFENIITRCAEISLTVVPSCVSMVSNMAADPVLRRCMSARAQLWEACLQAMDVCLSDQTKYDEVLEPLTGLMVNLTLKPTAVPQEPVVALATVSKIHGLLDSPNATIVQRSAGILSHILPHSEESVKVCQDTAPLGLFRLLKDPDLLTVKYAMKALSACTKDSEIARRTVLQQDNKIETLRSLLKVEDEQLQANSALCVGHLLSDKALCERLYGTDIVMELLRHVADHKNGVVQKNCAIALANLTQEDRRHINRLRELRGLGILRDCMKHFN